MSTGRPNPGGTSLGDECARFSAQPPNARPIDALWHEYAYNPALARRDFDTHLPEYAQSGVIRVTAYTDARSVAGGDLARRDAVAGKLKVVAAFGGALLASSTGNTMAQEVFRHMQPSIRTIGRTALGHVVQSIGETHIKGAGSALGLYLAANTSDNQGLRRHESLGRLEPVDELWPDYLQVRYQGSRDKVASLSMAYAEIATMTGAYLKFYQDPSDLISARHIEDFVDSCLRLVMRGNPRTADSINKATRQVSRELGTTVGHMFSTGATLLCLRGRRVKGFDWNIEDLTRDRLNDGSDGTPPPWGEYTSGWDGYMPPQSEPYSPPRQRTQSQTPPPRPTSSVARRSDLPDRTASYRIEDYGSIRPEHSIGALFGGPIDHELDRVTRLTAQQRQSYPWASLYAALSFRRSTWLRNRSPKEERFFAQYEQAIAERAAKQLLDSYATGVISSATRGVRPDYLGAAVELRPWLHKVLRGEVQSRAVTPERAAPLLRQLNNSLDTHLMRAYGVQPYDLQNAALRETLLQLTLFDNSRLRDDPINNRVVLINWYNRIAHGMRGRVDLWRLPSRAQEHYAELHSIKMGWDVPYQGHSWSSSPDIPIWPDEPRYF